MAPLNNSDVRIPGRNSIKLRLSLLTGAQDSIPGMPGMLGMPGMPGMAAAPPPVASTGAWSGTSPAAGLPGDRTSELPWLQVQHAACSSGEGREDKVATVHITGLPPGSQMEHGGPGLSRFSHARQALPQISCSRSSAPMARQGSKSQPGQTVARRRIWIELNA